MDTEKNGFTLIELLIVIAIISLLVAMGLPSLNRAKALAKRVACKSNLHAVGIGFRMYLDQNNEIMPVAARKPSMMLTNDPRIADVLEPWLSGPEVLKCPADTEKDYYISEGSSYEYNSKLSGREVSRASRWLGENNTHVMNDYDPFHGPRGSRGSRNFLFVDMHVSEWNIGLGR